MCRHFTLCIHVDHFRCFSVLSISASCGRGWNLLDDVCSERSRPAGLSVEGVCRLQCFVDEYIWLNHPQPQAHELFSPKSAFFTAVINSTYTVDSEMTFQIAIAFPAQQAWIISLYYCEILIAYFRNYLGHVKIIKSEWQNCWMWCDRPTSKNS